MSSSRANRPMANLTQRNNPMFFRQGVDQLMGSVPENKINFEESEGANQKTNFFGDPAFFSPKNTVQARLKTGEPNDPFEKEADAVADKVVNGKGTNTDDGKGSPRLQLTSVRPNDLQKGDNSQNPENLQDTASAAEVEGQPAIQKMEAEEEVQTKVDTPPSAPAPSIENRLNNSKGNGAKLGGDEKKEMESGFGADFSDVSIHTDENAVQMNQDIGAQAFTHGNDIYFNKNKYQPDSTEGKHLLAHELTHTIQQNGKLQKKENGHSISPTSNNVQTGFWSKVWGGVKNVGNTLWSGAKKIGGAFESVWDTATQYVGKGATWVWEGLKSLGGTAWSWLKAAGSKVWQAIKWFGNKSWEMIKTLGVVLWEKLVWLGQNAWSYISNIPRRAWRLVVHSWEGIKGAAGWIWSGLEGAAKHVWKAIHGTFHWLKDGFSGLLGWLGDGLGKGAKWAYDFIKSPSLAKLWDGLLGGLSWLGEGITGFAKWGWRGIQGAALWAWEGVKGLAGWIWDGITGTVKWLGKRFMLILDLLGVGEALQVIWGLIFRMRRLTPTEISASLMVHPAGMIPYDLIRVDENSIISSMGGGSAVTTMHIIHSPKGGIFTDTMVHELTHVAQYENVGSVYMAEAIHAQTVHGRTGGGIGSGDAYDYTRTGTLAAQTAAGLKYKDLNRESQAELVQDYYIQLNSSFTKLPQADYLPFINDMQNGEF